MRNYQEPDIIEHGPQEIKSLEQPMLTEEDNCRICLKAENSTENPLLSVCVCKGSVRFVHFICLRKWLNYIMSEKIHYNRYGVNNSHGNNFAFHGFQADNQNGKTVENEVAEEEDQPDAFKGQIPERVFPDQQTADVQ